MTDFELNAQARADMGKGASRRLRRLDNLVPAIVYGGEKAPQNIAIPHKDLAKALETEAFYSHLITLHVDGASETVILKDLQRHPAKPRILHADFLRVDKNRKLHVRVPLHFINEDTCKAVKTQGAVISHLASELEITCLPHQLPEYITVDLANATMGQIIHIGDIKLPPGVESVALSHGDNQGLASVHAPKGGATEEAAE